MPPSPRTAKRRRMAKLRRHLGEPILDEAIYAQRPLSPCSRPPSYKEQVSELGERLTYIHAAIKVGRVLDMASDEESSTGDSEDKHDRHTTQEVQDYTWVLEDGGVFRGVQEDASVNGKRCQWMYDKGGKRWEEHDYNAVLKALRAL